MNENHLNAMFVFELMQTIYLIKQVEERRHFTDNAMSQNLRTRDVQKVVIEGCGAV